MASDNNEVSANMGSAALKGAKNAIGEKIVEPLSKLAEPGDMNPKHMPHPLDDLANKVAETPDRLAKLTTPGDMNPKHAPHPVDATLAAADESIGKIKAAGPLKGTELAAQMAVGAIIDSANPGKKLKLADEALDAATGVTKTAEKVRHVQGDLVDDIASGKGLVVPEAVEAKTGLAKIKEQATGLKNKALDKIEGVPVVGDLLAPKLDQRIINQAHKEKPGMLDHMDETHRIGGDPSVMYAKHDDKLQRAQVLAEQVKNNPEAAAAINRKVTDKDISDLLNKSTNEQLGLPQNPNAVPKLPSPEQQAVIDARTAQLEAGKQRLADEQAYQATLNPVQRTLRQIKLDNTDAENGSILHSRYGQSGADKLKSEASDRDSDTIRLIVKNNARAATQVVVGAGTLTYIGLHSGKDSAEDNKNLSEAFLHAVKRGDQQGFKEAVNDSNGQLKNAVDLYQHTKEQLTIKGGGLDDADREALKGVAATMAKQIETQGPASFGEVSKANEHNLQR